MTSASTVINRSLKTHIAPILKGAGFDRVEARNAWAWKGPSIWVFTIRAVGAYFSDVTGWPPSSLSAWIGIFYTFMDPPPGGVKSDEKGRLLPKEVQCDRRGHLVRKGAGDPMKVLRNPQERIRRDLWWVEPDGSNAEEVAKDIAEVLKGPGMTWYSRNADVARTFEEVESEDDCVSKFVLARQLADHLGRVDASNRFKELAEEEGRKVDLLPDPGTWYPRLGGGLAFPVGP